jgi:hypothetical protein
MLRVWVVLATLFCAGGCAEDQPRLLRSAVIKPSISRTARSENIPVSAQAIASGETSAPLWSSQMVSTVQGLSRRSRPVTIKERRAFSALSLDSYSFMAPSEASAISTAPLRWFRQTQNSSRIWSPWFSGSGLMGIRTEHSIPTYSPLSRVDFGGSVGRGGTSRHLDNLQALAAMTDDDTLGAVARIDQSGETGIQFVDGGLGQGVDVHRNWGVWASLRPAQLTETTGLRLAPPSLGCILARVAPRGYAVEFLPKRSDSEASDRAEFWRREDSNFRPLGYEPSELPLLYGAESFVTRRSNRTQALIVWPRPLIDIQHVSQSGEPLLIAGHFIPCFGPTLIYRTQLDSQRWSIHLFPALERRVWSLSRHEPEHTISAQRQPRTGADRPTEVYP